MESPDDRALAARARLRHALAEQAREIERLEASVRALRVRHSELGAAIEEDGVWSGDGESAAGGIRPRPAEDGDPLRPTDGVKGSRAESEEEKRLREARRFARLLVSEIALYHPEQVEQGRQNRDLYARLRATIDRSRQAYDRRFGQGRMRGLDFFHEALVKSLAEDDPALLGAGYPGPSK